MSSEHTPTPTPNTTHVEDTRPMEVPIYTNRVIRLVEVLHGFGLFDSAPKAEAEAEAAPEALPEPQTETDAEAEEYARFVDMKLQIMTLRAVANGWDEEYGPPYPSRDNAMETVYLFNGEWVSFEELPPTS